MGGPREDELIPDGYDAWQDDYRCPWCGVPTDGLMCDGCVADVQRPPDDALAALEVKPDGTALPLDPPF